MLIEVTVKDIREKNVYGSMEFDAYPKTVCIDGSKVNYIGDLEKDPSDYYNYIIRGYLLCCIIRIGGNQLQRIFFRDANDYREFCEKVKESLNEKVNNGLSKNASEYVKLDWEA